MAEAVNNLTGCAGSYPGGTLKLPVDTHVLMPWVEVWFLENDQKKIAVGNTSSRDNLAVIKSFQFGGSNGAGCTFEIVDEEGGDFSRFFQKLATGNQEAVCKYTMQFRWGWAKMDCHGGGKTFGDVAGGPTADSSKQLMSTAHTMVILNAKCDVTKGMFKFTIEGVDLTAPLHSSRTTVIEGEDGKPIFVTEAIKKLMARFGVEVEFKRMKKGGGGVEDIIWKKDSITTAGGSRLGSLAKNTQGTKAKWESANLDPLSIAREWINCVLTDKGKGVVMFWDTSKPKPTLVFLENPFPACEKEFNSSGLGLNVAKYIVNGGGKSPVISFNPQIQWSGDPMMYKTGGTPGDAQSPKMFLNDFGPEPCWDKEDKKNMNQLDGQGLMNTQVQVGGMLGVMGKDTNKILTTYKLPHLHGNMKSNSIAAELRIQGDPSYSYPLLNLYSYITIVFINPFYLAPAADAPCSWLSKPPCNDILSNTNWMIMGIFHEIREGSYTTTLKVHLAAPGVDVPRGDNIGAEGGGGGKFTIGKPLSECQLKGVAGGLQGGTAIPGQQAGFFRGGPAVNVGGGIGGL